MIKNDNKNCYLYYKSISKLSSKSFCEVLLNMLLRFYFKKIIVIHNICNKLFWYFKINFQCLHNIHINNQHGTDTTFRNYKLNVAFTVYPMDERPIRTRACEQRSLKRERQPHLIVSSFSLLKPSRMKYVIPSMKWGFTNAVVSLYNSHDAHW